MATPSPVLRRTLSGVAGAAVVLLAATACSSAASIENTDVPAWKATALPTIKGAVLEDAGKILNREPIVQVAASVPAGSYTLTLKCDGGGKTFLAVSSIGKEIQETGAACNGSRETVKVTLAESGPVEISATSVDAPLLYAYRLVAAK
ncbi:hypothetical protein [Pseudarthrobacter sp. N5]|uniref:hypothetical protein n=1 Tax=Pseudarthrobacter sp. N5 TaxID=3418416 RepID=UPI003CF03A7B